MSKTLQISQSLREWMDAVMHRSMREWTRFAKTTGLSMSQFSVLMQLHHRGPCGMSEISERFDVTPAAASQLVEKLVQAGYLERTEDPSDRRAKLLKLSPSGATLIEQGIRERYRWLDDLVQNLSVEEQLKVGEALEILTRASQAMES
ncbi:MAG: MarR family transcriptional regulator [Anaerolineales bacterium]